MTQPVYSIEGVGSVSKCYIILGEEVLQNCYITLYRVPRLKKLTLLCHIICGWPPMGSIKIAYKAKQRCVMGIGMCLYAQLVQTKTKQSSSSRMHVINHNWSATKQRLHPQTVAEIRRHSVLSGDSIRQCETLSGSHHKDTDQCL